ncbi:MAG TPA: SHOCT domain-containing protein [Thermoleophilia bacterium]|nr:SHOCT domain-containing protein [Thermoleophilia bacterium]
MSVIGVLAGCVQRVPYPDLGMWDGDVKVLGPATACQGGHCCPNNRCQWPLALTVPPPTETYHRALVDDAVNRYDVPAAEVVLDNVMVTLHTEVVGTVRGWAAEAVAGRRPSEPDRQPALTPSSKAETRLKNLDELYRKGLLTEDEFKARRKAILDEL